MLSLRHAGLVLVWLVGCGVVGAAPVERISPPAELSQNPNFTNTVEYQRWWWAFSQRAVRPGVIPEDAKLKALDQIKQAKVKEKKDRAAGVLKKEAAALGEIQGEHWVNVGPRPLVDEFGVPTEGRVANVAVNPSNVNHWMIGAAQGGVWDTRDAGLTWTPRTDDQASLAMGAIAFAPSATNIIYAGTGEGVGSPDAYAGIGLLKSTNAGTNWQLLATNTFAKSSFKTIRVKATDPNVLLAATTRGFAGVSGGAPPSPPPVGIHKSSDGGVTWSLKLNANIFATGVGGGWDIESVPGDFNRHYASAGSALSTPTINGVYRSVDAGESWQLITGPWTSMIGRVDRIEMALAPSATNTLYVSIQDGQSGNLGALLGVWKTTNAWATTPTWTQLPNPPTTQTRFWYNHDIMVDPANANVIYLGEIDLWKYNGSSWANVIGNIHEDQHSLAWAGNRLVVGNDGGVWSTVNGGSSWTNHNATLSVIQFYQGSLHPTNPNLAVGGSQDNGTEVWRGPQLWTAFWGADGGFNAISAVRPDTDWAGSVQFLGIFRTTDAGASIIPATLGIDPHNALFIAPFKKCPCNNDVFIAATDNLWKSTNFFQMGQPSWSLNRPAADGEVLSALAFAPSDTNCQTYAFGTASFGQVQVTSNGGGTWNDLLNFGRWISAIAFHPTNANILYVTLSSFNDPTFPPLGHVFKTMNALAASPTFINVSPPVDIPFNAIVLDPANPNIVYVGTDIGIWKSRDAGTNWTHIGPESGIPNVAVLDIQASAGAGRLVAFTHGRGAFALVSPPVAVGSRSGKNFVLSFASLPAAQYTVQFKNSLNDVGWQTLTSVTGDGTVKSLTNNVALSPQRYFRVAVW